jgi:predicted transposase/invertase (TIGR01784 family)
MQSQRRPAQRERALYYWARMYAGQLRRGAPYTDLRRCAVVLITSFAELAGPYFHSVFRVHDQSGAGPLTDHLELHLVELPKLRPSLDANNEPALAAWGRFLTATTDDDLETLAKEYPVLRQAKDALDELSQDEVARIRAEQQELAELSYELHLTAARREGQVEGRVRGKADLLQQLLTLKFGELPSEVSARLGAAREAELVCWSERVLTADTLGGVFSE